MTNNVTVHIIYTEYLSAMGQAINTGIPLMSTFMTIEAHLHPILCIGIKQQGLLLSNESMQTVADTPNQSK